MEFLKIAKIISTSTRSQSYREMKEDAEKPKWINTASIAVQNSKPDQPFCPQCGAQTRFQKEETVKSAQTALKVLGLYAIKH